ncbi:MAG: hypothetical protein ACREL4_07685 [Gemmatimonadales bacterium]
MRNLWIFLHLLGIVMWLGGGLAVMFAGIASKQFAREQLGSVARLLAVIHARVIGPGAVLVVLSGLVLSMQLMSAFGAGAGGMISPWIMSMQGAGLLGAVLVIVVSWPTSMRAARIDPVSQAAAFDSLRTRLRVVGAISGLLGFIALLSGAMYR